MFTALGGVRLNVVEAGTGPPVVFLHPLGGNWRYWEPQLNGLSDRFRCIAPDLRGFGASDRDHALPFSFDVLSDDIAALCAALDVPSAHIVGLSMGGMVAQHVALRHPEIVERLVLASTSCHSDPAMVDMVKAAVGLIEQYGLGMFVEASSANTWAPATVSERPELVRRFQREEGSTDPRVYAAAVEAVAFLDLRDRLGAVEAPALVLHGALDAWMPVSHAEELAAALPSATTTILEGAGHLANLEVPPAFNDAVAGFLAGAGNDPAGGAG